MSPDDTVPADAITVVLLDTLTGKTAERTYFNKWWWTDGNGSCDCNRAYQFMTEEEVNDAPDTGFCDGCQRYLIIGASEGPLSDYNHGYPPELLEKYLPINA